jgi:hypothetical protein
MTSCPTSWAEPICSRHRHSVLEIYRSVSRSFTQTETPSDARFWWAGAAPHERITGPDRPSATFPHRVTPWSRAATRAGGGGRRRADVPPVPRRHQTPIPGQNRHATYCPWPDVEPKNQKAQSVSSWRAGVGVGADPVNQSWTC